MNLEEFIKSGNLIHNGKYDYTKFHYVNMNTKGIIICPEHGEFLQTPKAHIRQKYGCSKCGRILCANKNKKDIDQIISQFNKIHGDKYDYSKVEYINAYTKVCIICKKHGEFWQTPHEHLKGHGCPKCGSENSANKIKLTKEEFIEKAKKIHGNKYDYSLVEYINCNTKVKIICPIHGIFEQTPNSHINGSGCPKCGNKKISESKKFDESYILKKFKDLYGDKFTYHFGEDYKNINSIIDIECKEHGLFKQTVKEHLNGHNCPYCNGGIKYTNDTFIKKGNKVHKGKYDYSLVNYKNSNEKVKIICPIHGIFEQTPVMHLYGEGCPKCANQLSKAENEIYEFCCKYVGSDNVQQRNKILIHPYELDIYLPTLNSAIEYNGLRWHSEKFGKDSKYHLNKLNKCKERGIKLIQIFEDEYLNHRDIVYNKIKHILKLDSNLTKIMGRKCIIQEIDNNVAEAFLNTYHIQGYARSTVYLGAFYNNELIAVMTFRKENINGNNWELTRFASNYNYICQGIGGKLFKYFINNYQYNEIKSFADRRWTIDEENNVYLQLGFKFDKYIKPDYTYFKENDGLIRQHKFGFRKERLHKKYNLPISMTEDKMAEELGYTKIWNCGLIKYVYKNEKNN